MAEKGHKESQAEFDVRRYVLTAISLHWHYRRSAPPAGLALPGSPRAGRRLSGSRQTRDLPALDANRRGTAG
jgi:hypothetical protein